MKLLKNSSYIRFLNALDGLDRINPGRALDSLEEQMLNQICLKFFQGKELLVGDLIQLSQFGSQATLHGRLKNLVAMGYAQLSQDKADGRKKMVLPSTKARKYYEKLSACLEKAVAAN